MEIMKSDEALSPTKTRKNIIIIQKLFDFPLLVLVKKYSIQKHCLNQGKKSILP